MHTIAIAGNPNAGKTCVFNMLTGMVQHVANYPGVTVETKEAVVRLGNEPVRIIDLPGTYSLTAYSADERVARDVILQENPDLVINVIDASNLERNLYLTTQLMEMGLSLVVALNMSDVANKRGQVINVSQLARLLGVFVVPTQAHRGVGARELKEACLDVLRGELPSRPKHVTYGHPIATLVMQLADRIRADPNLAPAYAPRWLAVKLLEGDPEVLERVGREAADFRPIHSALRAAKRELSEHFREDAATVLAEARYGFAAGAVRQCLEFSRETRRTHTDMIDALVCHRVIGPLILAGAVLAIFKLLFLIAQESAWIPWLGGQWFSPVGAFEQFFAWLGSLLTPLEPAHPLLHSILHDAVIGGVGGVLNFVPLIFTMFVLISILEDSGYIARIAFIMDRVLKAFGLQGKSILALIVAGGLGGGGCAVPGVLATRTLREEKDRLVTILVTPFMNCGAKLPVYAVLIAAFFPHSRGTVLFVLWLSSWCIALGAAWLLRRYVVKGEQEPFVMELPPYHLPTLRGMLMHSGRRTWLYIKKAGTIILGVNLVLWSLMYFPRTPDLSAEALAKAEAGPEAEAQAHLAGSAAGRFGRALEPVSRLAGFTWRENVALLGGFAAKELVIGTLGTAYAMDARDAAPARGLSSMLQRDPAWTRRRAVALMLFVMIYAPCMPTLITIRKETRRLKWALFATAYSTALAFVLAVAVYQLAGLLGWGG
ncbi:MAG: ferrous iron transport protein B [Kiritimatiellae bacterium]|nr:ferrous iron transport protein B [Kiritimatiellia bacterium]